MKLIAYIILAIVLSGLFSCSHNKSLQSSATKEKTIQFDEVVADSIEYDLIITDPGFEPWFQKHHKPSWYHNKEVLEMKNWQYVSAWNEKVRDAIFQIRNSNNPFIELIDYQLNLDYGLDVNYKLYYYFKYIEDTWGKFL